MGEAADDLGAGARRSENGSKTLYNKHVWLDAWNDPVAGISAYTPCIHTCNLAGDGEHRLVIADNDKKLKVWKGTQLASKHALLDQPVAITSFVAALTSPRVLSLAVAAGSHVYIYRNLRPYYKFVLPPEAVDDEEQSVWLRVMNNEMVVGEAVARITELQARGVVLTSRSLQLCNIPDTAAKTAFVEHWQGTPLMQATVVTCMTTIAKAVEEPDSVSCLVLGTESGRVLILNTTGTEVTHNMWLGVTPTMLAVSGELDVGYRITIAGRDGKLYSIRNGEVSDVIIQLEAQPVGLVRMNKSVYVGCMNEVIHNYLAEGRKNYTLYLPAPILTMTPVNVAGSRAVKGVATALSNGEVRLYIEKALVSVHLAPSPVTALLFGRYGREDNSLITINKLGALDIKILPRTANLSTSAKAGPPPEQDIPLAVPKKTRLYVEQTQRERESASDMHRAFQRELARLRLSTARAYVKVLTDGQGAAAFTSNASLNLNLKTAGLGPLFKLMISLRNEGSTHLLNTLMVLAYNPTLYKVEQQQVRLPLILPSLNYTFEVNVECLDPNGVNDTVTVLLCNPNSSLPLLQAQVKMPISEPNYD